MNLHIQIITSPFMTKKIKRKWKERLFSFPWNPFKKFNVIPDEDFYLINNCYYCHPSTKEKLNNMINKI